MIGFVYFLFECTAFITCLLAYKNLDKGYKWFLPFLTFVVIYEFVNIFDWLNLHNSNAWCSNFEGIVELALYAPFIASLDKRKSYRKKVYAVTVAGIIISLIDILFIQGFYKLATIAIVLQNSILVILICIYFYNLISDNDENLDLLKHPPFYITTGLLFYGLANFFFFAAYSYMVFKNNYHFYIFYKVVTNLAAFILYSLLSVAFIFILRQKKLSGKI